MRISGGKRKGFTIIEVILVLAIVAMLFVGLVAIQGPNLARRRYEDTVNNFQAFLQGQFDFSTNIQNWREGALPNDACGSANPGNDNAALLGRSSCVIYGIMVEFGWGGTGTAGRVGCDPVNNPRCGAGAVRYSWVVGSDFDRDTLFEFGDAGWVDMDDFEVLRNADLQRSASWNDYLLEWGGELERPVITSPGWTQRTDAYHPQRVMLILRLPVTGTIMTFLFEGDLFAETGLRSVFMDRPTNASPVIRAEDRVTGRGIWEIIRQAQPYVLNREMTLNYDGTITTTALTPVQLNNPRRIMAMCIGSPDIFRVGGSRAGGHAKRILTVLQGGSNASAVMLLDQDVRVGANMVEIDGGLFDVRCN